VKVLILNPVNPQAVAASIEAAKNAGIPVITVDRPVEKGAITHVGRDNVKMGALVGQAVLDYLKSKNIQRSKKSEFES
jgi:ribose transport system substrate-binding protein